MRRNLMQRRNGAFLKVMGRDAAIRWVNKHPPAQAIISAAQDYDYELRDCWRPAGRGR